MNKLKQLKLNIWIGYILLALYVVSAIGLVYYLTTMDMLPLKYIVIISLALIVFAVLLAIMHQKLVSSIIAIVLSVALIVGCIGGSFYAVETSDTLAAVTSSGEQTDVISVYVMADDEAEVVKDIVDYQIGILSTTDRDNTDKTIESLEGTLGTTFQISEYDDMFTMADALQAQTIQAIIINDAYVGIIADVEGYDWVSTDLKKITEVAHAIEITTQEEVPDDVPETFVMYLSGIDTYGGVSARSRSDVNILAVVNTETKNVLLLSTPRDSYVSYSVTGGAKDKLTHAGIYGVDASIDALQQLYDISVDYYLRINFTGFVEVIDALGGIDVNSDYEFTVENIRTYTVGENHLTGLEALAFARERYSFADGDYQRARNQMEVIRAIIDECASSSILKNYASVMSAISGSFETNMPQDQIASLVKMQLSDMAEWTVTSYTTSGQSTYAETYSMPGQQLYVIELDQSSIDEAKQMIQNIYNGS